MNLYLVKGTDHTFPVDANSESEAIALYCDVVKAEGMDIDFKATVSRATAQDYLTLQGMVAKTFSKRLWIAISDDGIEPLYAITRDDAWELLAEKYGSDVADVKDGGDWTIRAFNEKDWWEYVERADNAEEELASLRSRLSDIAEEG